MAKGITGLGAAFIATPSTLGWQYGTDMAAFADGGFVVTWATLGLGVFGQRYNSSGIAVGEEFQIGSNGMLDVGHATVTILDDGGFVVAWMIDRQDSSYHDILAQRYDASGVAVGVEFQVNTTSQGYQVFQSITALDDGGFVVLWESSWSASEPDVVQGQRYDASGVAVGGEFTVSTPFSGGDRAVSVAASDGGGFVVTWSLWDDATSSREIYGQAYDALGALVGGGFQINTTAEGGQGQSEIEALEGGGFVVTWTSTLNAEVTIRAQLYDAALQAVGGEILVNTTFIELVPFQSLMRVAALADGGFVVVWGSQMAGTADISLYGQRFDALGDTVGAEVLIAPSTMSTYGIAADVIGLDDGSFVISWETDTFEAGGMDILAQQFKAKLFGTSEANTIIDDIGANWINGQTGADILRGRGGDDTIFGGNGYDQLFGGAGADTLKGQAGNDILVGGRGQDTLTGGAGADTFVFRNAAESSAGILADTITDFELGVDHLDLSVFSATYIANGSFSGAIEVQVTSNGTDSAVYADTDGDGITDMKIIVEGVVGLTAGDFVL